MDFTAGFGYDFISQEFFIDSLTEVGEDSLAAITSLNTTYLDDFKARFTLKYIPHKDRSLDLRAEYEQTPDFIRTKFLADYRPHLGRSRLDILSELDWRGRHSGSTEAGDDYLLGQASVRLTVPLSESVSARWSVRGDFVNFDSTSTLSYDHYRFGAKAGIGRIAGDFSMLDIDVFFLFREVPDSVELGYGSFGLESSYLGFYDSGELDVFGRLERKDYGQPEAEDDYWRLELAGRNRLRLGDRYFLRQELNTEFNFFNVSDLVSYDYARIDLRLLAGTEGGGLSISLGGDFEWQEELDAVVEEPDDYFETGLMFGFDYLESICFFGSFESILGRRTLQEETETQTNFTYERLSLIADWKLPAGLSFSLLLSAEWEWHDDTQENNRSLLFSSGLALGF